MEMVSHIQIRRFIKQDLISIWCHGSTKRCSQKANLFAYIIFNLNNSTSLINSLTKDLSIEDTICTFKTKFNYPKPECLKMKGIYFFLNLRIKITIQRTTRDSINSVKSHSPLLLSIESKHELTTNKCDREALEFPKAPSFQCNRVESKSRLVRSKSVCYDVIKITIVDKLYTEKDLLQVSLLRFGSTIHSHGSIHNTKEINTCKFQARLSNLTRYTKFTAILMSNASIYQSTLNW